MDLTIFDGLLTDAQVRRLARKLSEAKDLEHATVRVRYVKGLPRFISIEAEETFDPNVDGSALDRMRNRDCSRR